MPAEVNTQNRVFYPGNEKCLQTGQQFIRHLINPVWVILVISPFFIVKNTMFLVLLWLYFQGMYISIFGLFGS